MYRVSPQDKILTGRFININEVFINIDQELPSTVDAPALLVLLESVREILQNGTAVAPGFLMHGTLTDIIFFMTCCVLYYTVHST